MRDARGCTRGKVAGKKKNIDDGGLKSSYNEVIATVYDFFDQ